MPLKFAGEFPIYKAQDLIINAHYFVTCESDFTAESCNGLFSFTADCTGPGYSSQMTTEQGNHTGLTTERLFQGTKGNPTVRANSLQCQSKR